MRLTTAPSSSLPTAWVGGWRRRTRDLPSNRDLRKLSWSDSKHSTYPRHDLRRAEGDGDPKNGCETPSPGNSICHRHSSEHHHENDGNGCEPLEDVFLQRGHSGQKR